MWRKGREEWQGERWRGRGGEISPNLSRAQANRGEHSAFRRQAQDLIDTQCETCEVSQLAPSWYLITALWLRIDSQRCMSTCHKLGASALEKFSRFTASWFTCTSFSSVRHSNGAEALVTWHGQGKPSKVLSAGYEDLTQHYPSCQLTQNVFFLCLCGTSLLTLSFERVGTRFGLTVWYTVYVIALWCLMRQLN